MTRYFNEAMKILDNELLKKEDVDNIRNLYGMFSIEEYESIGRLEEIIEQIQITPRNDEVIEN